MTARLLLTMGDAAGIGPETIVRAFLAGALDGTVVVGDAAVMRRAARACGAPFLPLAVLQAPSDLHDVPAGALPLVVPPELPTDLAARPFGKVDAGCGRAAWRCIEYAVECWRRDATLALVTAPVHKEALAAAGCPFPGHTEMLQHLAADGGALPPVRMMLANDELRVVLVTIHVALRRAIELLSRESVLETIVIAWQALRRFGLSSPRLAVAGLNPHAGEGGLFGDEELRIIAPAVEAARAQGLDVTGPLAPDTVFMRARRTAARAGEFDAVVAMTHDHGLIPVKYLGVDQGVNLTLGLPFVRCSPDHGTAFDIAGRGIADPASLRSALALARRLADSGPR